MPTILDATVVASAYATSASARPQRLSNGWIVASAYDSTGLQINFYVDKRDGNGFVPLCYRTGTNVTYSVVCKGTIVYVVMIQSNGNSTFFFQFDATTVTNTNVVSIPNIDTSQNSYNPNPSLTINEAKTELHATWASKNATYPNSFNIRYAKGTIATDGSVAWGAVEQVTKMTAINSDFVNPSIVLNGSVVSIIANTEDSYLSANSYTGGAGASSIVILQKSTFLTVNNYLDASWTYKNVYNVVTYVQSNPSAIFVPQSINGLANGRIWVVWHGTDSVDTAATNIRNSYSDDGGATWSAMQKVTSGNLYSQLNPSVTCNKQNKIFTVWHGRDEIAINNIKKTNNVDGTITKLTNNTTSSSTDPSTLYDSAFNFAEPLFIYKNAQTAKVGFYGTWTVTTISVTQGSIGQKTDKANVLTYAIETDGVMSSITEKVNGVTIGTKTATSGQSQIAGLTQAQWDAVKFGKYKDVTGGLNTLTIEMGTEVYTYTFDKRPATDADMLSVAKAVQDSANVYLPAAKSKLGTAIRAKGGTVNDTDSLEVMASAVGNMAVAKKASGTISSGATNSGFTNSASTVVNLPFVLFNMSNLPFIPSLMEFKATNKGSTGTTQWRKDDHYIGGVSNYANATTEAYALRAPYVNGVMYIPVPLLNREWSWIAYE